MKKEFPPLAKVKKFAILGAIVAEVAELVDALGSGPSPS